MEQFPLNRLFVISNRVQPPSEDGPGNQGGLAVALSAALRETNGIWFGWSGVEVEHYSGQINFQRSQGVATATVDLESQDIEEYYNGYANRTLWPLFHYRIDLAEFERGFKSGYERVNARFADTLLPLIEDNDLVWVNDYHLIPLGCELRQRGCANRIGFFLHIPWPPMRLLLALPGHRELVESLFAYDVIGFQAQEWLDSFGDYLRAQFGLEPDEAGRIVYEGRSVQLVTCPIGIDTPSFRATAEGPEATRIRSSMELSLNGRAMIIGVDRLDYSKGLPERFLGYERLLTEQPDLHEQVFLLQIAPPSRVNVQSYREIRAELEGLSGRINGEFATAEWVPLRYVNKSYAHDALAGMYRAADIGLVTPLRDGMNLVAKEFVAAQDPDNPGVLVLSAFAGAAYQMPEAILVNPYSPEELADAIRQALAMPLDERKHRWRNLMDNVEQNDVMWWMRSFVGVLAGSAEAGEGNSSHAQDEPKHLQLQAPELREIHPH